jgi:predicted aminopeptidase
MKIKIVLGFLSLMIAGLLTYRDLLVYGVAQGIGQMKIIIGAKPVSKWLSDPNLDPEIRRKLLLVNEIRNYAFDSIGLAPSKNYTTMYDQKGETSMWLVTASEPFALKAKIWKFPVLGTFSYKGYFNIDRAKKERDALDAEGWDVNIRSVGGWSTMGWFKDPILSGMLNRKDGDLANLIIHELSHSSIFVKDDADLNENIATFIGDKGAEIFLKQYYGEESGKLKAYLESKADSETFSLYILKSAQELESLYQSFDESMTEEMKLKLKNEKIQSIVDGLKAVNFFRNDLYHRYFENGLPNNTFFMGFIRYRSRQGIFEQEFQEVYGGDLRKMTQALAEKYPPI